MTTEGPTEREDSDRAFVHDDITREIEASMTSSVSDVIAPGSRDGLRGRTDYQGVDMTILPATRHETSIRDASFVVVDIETTGFSPATDSVLEVAALRLEPSGSTSAYESLVRYGPACDLPPESPVGFSGIPAGGLATAPFITDVLTNLGQFMLGAVPVAHSASFEQRFLEPRGMPIETSVCTVKLGRAVVPTCSRKLAALATHLGCPHTSTHRAMTDVVTTAWVFGELLQLGGMWEQSWTVGRLLSAYGVGGGRS